METSIKSFVVPSMNQVRVSVDAEGAAWFVVADVCTALGLRNPTMAVASLDDDERTLITIEGASNGLPVNAVNESGLYNLIFQSRRPEAKAFRKWVTSEVLPSIRKFGRVLPPAQLASKRRYSTPAIEEAIREEYDPKWMTMRGLGEKYGVGRMTVFRIVHSN